MGFGSISFYFLTFLLYSILIVHEQYTFCTSTNVTKTITMKKE
ncbi:hypothetical protein A0O32_2208 [Anoxybacillus flavithermus]|uniref:Uncharacterized protein n=1 Tax=Anoxybacillus flavithermus TaxID=33934 RepID=A0A178T4M0_9BACL|nr:hypothetical protein TAF16_2609 [Anoxybacillus flavithermus]OAO78078.1 hypothetical protein A0O32_2208 [Anoxybacillus flavithermus]